MMNLADRRAFLRKLAAGVAYAAPVVHSMAAPVDLVGQGKSSEKKKMWDPDDPKGNSGMTDFVPPPGQSALTPTVPGGS
jgi:hypothetical protein